MARKTKRPRTTRPASGTPEAEAESIADAETVQGNTIEDAELVSESEKDVTGQDAGEHPPLPDDPMTLAEETSTEKAQADGAVVGDPSDTEATPGTEGESPDEMAVVSDAGSTDTAETDGISDADEVRASSVPPVGAGGLGEDTVPPEDNADLSDLARMDGADPDKVEADAEDASDMNARDKGEARAAPASTPTMAAPPPPADNSKGSGFVPLVLGGLLAGAIGYAIPTFFAPEVETVDPAAFAALEARIDDLPTAAPDAPDLSAIETVQAEMSERLDTLSSRIDALEARPASAATQSAGASTATPSDDGAALAELRAEVESLSDVPADLDALSQRVDALAGSIDGLTATTDSLTATTDGLTATASELTATVESLPAPAPDMSERVAALETELADLDAETQAVEVSAEELAREAATNQIRIAFESGVPYAEPLSVIGGEPPAVLAENAETGLPTAGTLAGAFSEAARAALTEARRVAPEEGGLSAFIRRSTGARSLEPREGDDADAILSRAEAAIREGDVETALSEVEALPPEAQDAMGGWIADARTRVEARAALSDYLGTE